MSNFLNGQPIIDDSGSAVDLFPVDKGRGLEPRDYSIHPPEMFAPPSDIKLIPRSEWSARIKDKIANQSQLSDIVRKGNGGQPIPTIDQGPNGYCWGHSTVQGLHVLRAVNNQPYIPLSAYAVCATIKRGVNEGGWCGLSAKFLREKGVPSQKLWPQGDRDYQKYNKPEVWADAAKHKVTEDYVDLSAAVYDQNLTFDMVATLLLSNIPVALDYNWWAHSICGLDLVEVEANSFGVRIWNSWGDGWGEKGMGILRGQKAIPDGALAQRVVGAVPQ